jgi:hypothetical protein
MAWAPKDDQRAAISAALDERIGRRRPCPLCGKPTRLPLCFDCVFNVRTRKQ